MVHGLRADKYFCTIAMKSDGNCQNMNIDIPIDIDIVIAGKMDIVLRFVLFQDRVGLQGLQLDLRADKYFCRIAMKSDGNGKNIDIDIVIAG